MVGNRSISWRFLLVLAAAMLLAGAGPRANQSKQAESEPQPPAEIDPANKEAPPPGKELPPDTVVIPAESNRVGKPIRIEELGSSEDVDPPLERIGGAKMGDGGGPHPATEKCVSHALIWLANHQLSDGSWSIDRFTDRCKDKTCTGPGHAQDGGAGATALGLLPFLATGQTHRYAGPHRKTIGEGLRWLISHQQPDGNLANKGDQQTMYSHGLATMALCEAYGLTCDREVGTAAQKAVEFIANAQNTTDHGWRYAPGDPGDTSVTAWQLSALTSARLAGLQVKPETLTTASKWLDSVAHANGSQYSYQPGSPPTQTMTAAGLLCRQYLGTNRTDPRLADGMKYLMNLQPLAGQPNVYCWYYVTQFLHNMRSEQYTQWNRKMREILVASQCGDAALCAKGSWDPAKDDWCRQQGGRLMMTSMATLILEVYYQYLPLLKNTSSLSLPAKHLGDMVRPSPNPNGFPGDT